MRIAGVLVVQIIWASTAPINPVAKIGSGTNVQLGEAAVEWAERSSPGPGIRQKSEIPNSRAQPWGG
eukprot:11012720-Alexandrium_andersonii.AAC.1